MLTRKSARTTRARKRIFQKTSSVKAMVYTFPKVEGMDDIWMKIATVKAETLFCALLKGYDLSPIENEEQAQAAERFLEYLLRAFEKRCPEQVKTYLHLLEMLIDEYDKKHTVAAAKNIPPHQLLKTILQEEGLDQKALVPSCFKSRSQVSEFLSQKRGREKLTAEQAISLGKRFQLNPLLFLNA